MAKTYYQAFPLGRDTYQGVPTNVSTKNKSIIRVNAMGDLTVNFEDGSLVIVVDAGHYFALEENVVSVSCTSEILMS